MGGVTSALRRQHAWEALAPKAAAEPSGSPDALDEASLEGLPRAGKLFLLNALREAPREALSANGVDVEMKGRFKRPGAGDEPSWMPCTASERIRCGVGFVWNATMRMMPLVNLSGGDMLFEGYGEVAFGLLGGVARVVHQGGDAATAESSLGRLLIEGFVWCPCVALPRNGARWAEEDPMSREFIRGDNGAPGIVAKCILPALPPALASGDDDKDRQSANFVADEELRTLHVKVDADGNLAHVWVMRTKEWDTAGNKPVREPFQGLVGASKCFGGVRIASLCDVGYASRQGSLAADEDWDKICPAEYDTFISLQVEAAHWFY